MGKKPQRYYQSAESKKSPQSTESRKNAPSSSIHLGKKPQSPESNLEAPPSSSIHLGKKPQSLESNLEYLAVVPNISVKNWTEKVLKDLDKPHGDSKYTSKKYYTRGKLDKQLMDPKDYKPVHGVEKTDVSWEEPMGPDWTKGDSDASKIPGKPGFTYAFALRAEGGRKILRIGKGRGVNKFVTIYHAEVFGVYRTVLNAIELKAKGKIKKLHLSCDNKLVVQWLTDVNAVIESDGPEVNALVPEIKRLLCTHFGKDWVITENPRQGLFLADYLCFLGLELDFNCEEIAGTWMDFTTRYFYFRDVRGPAYIKESAIPVDKLPQAEGEELMRKRKERKQKKLAAMSPEQLEAYLKLKNEQRRSKTHNKKERKRKKARLELG